MTKFLGLKKKGIYLILFCSVLFIGATLHVYKETKTMENYIQTLGQERTAISQKLASLREAIFALERNLWVAQNYAAGSKERSDHIQSSQENMYVIHAFKERFQGEKSIDIDELATNLQQVFNKVHSLLVTANSKDINGSKILLIEEFSPLIQKMAVLSNEISSQEEQKTEQLVQSYMASMETVKKELAIFSTIGLSILVLLGYYLTYKTTEKVSFGVESAYKQGKQLSNLIGNFLRKTKNLHGIHQGQDYSLKEISIVSKQMAQYSDELQEGAKNIAGITQDVDMPIQKLTLEIKKLGISIRELFLIEKVTKDFANQMDKICKKSKEMQELSFEVQMLSFRAEVDADDKNSTGRTLTYYSKEMKDLSNRSKNSIDQLFDLAANCKKLALNISTELRRGLVEGMESCLALNDNLSNFATNNQKVIEHLEDLQNRILKQIQTTNYLSQQTEISEYVSKNCEELFLDLITKSTSLEEMSVTLNNQLNKVGVLVDGQILENKGEQFQSLEKAVGTNTNLNCAS